MSDAVVYEQLDQEGQLDEDASAAGLNPETDLRRLSDVPMELSVEIGRAHMTVGVPAPDACDCALVSQDRARVSRRSP